MTLLVVGLGGAIGAVARYLTIVWLQDLTGGLFPWGTMLVNVAGSLALGFAMVWVQSAAPSPEVRDLITIGFLGSFTTFSAFSYEALAMLRANELWRAGGYAAGSVALGLIAVVVGGAVATMLTQARS